ncbi:hypothetical protein [Geobacter sp. DSM 9736]|uniref:hypothetical protein n=1 Tax=Geobacter sp. DSM 9736 TaxID=1277350 RepID=UPI000B506A0A|nr:hypothetical protein [Geobacter sp. DSM 9736]SNB44987.1 Dolichyl-phosphate-mannose-protein mannosyltransferase [Geobacter sp. DSM 9736]
MSLAGRRSFHIFPLFAVAIALLYYGRFLDNFFTFDDFKYLENMYRTRADVLIGYGSLRLLSNASWWPLFALSGFDPLGYNLFALILFTANAILLYVLLLRLIRDRQTAFLAAAFFVAGSVGADAIFWKATNSSLISLFFYLGSLILYVESRRDGSTGKFVTAFLLFAAAMFSKEEAASLPLVAAMVDILFLDGWRDRRGLAKRFTILSTVVFLYLAGNALVFNYLLNGQAEPQKLFRLRPLYSFLGGGTAFYLHPDGFIRVNSLPVYLTVLLIPVSFLIVRDRRLLLFGYLWVFLAFLPQSLTGLGQFEPRVIVNSVSRYLYITSIGSSIVFASILMRGRGILPKRWWYLLCAAVLVIFVFFHYQRVKVRGELWMKYGNDMKEFVAEMKRVVPALSGKCHVHVVNGPGGRAFIQQALRAFYANPEIYWIDDPEQTGVPAGEPVFVVLYQVRPEDPLQVFQVR